jgi:hypothetical protein
MWAADYLWRSPMVIFGLLCIAHGVFSKHMRIRDPGKLRGKIAKKRWQIVYMRTFFIVLGVLILDFAFKYNPQ